MLHVGVNLVSVVGMATPHLPQGGPKAARDFDGEVVYEVLDDVSPVVASRHGNRGDGGQPERLQDRPGSAPS